MINIFSWVRTTSPCILFTRVLAGTASIRMTSTCSAKSCESEILFTQTGSRTQPKRRHERTRRDLPEILDLCLSEVSALAEESERCQMSILVALSEADRALHELAQSFTHEPLMPALLEFCLLDLYRFSKVGQKSDLWGSFFLLLVTEYLKMELKRAHYREADELLHAARRIFFGRQLEESLSNHRPSKASKKKRGKWTAAKRIEKLKKSHPNWSDTVVPILLQLQLIRNGESHRYRANTRRFVERWMSEGHLTQKFLHELERRGLSTPANCPTHGRQSAAQTPSRSEKC